MIIVKNTHADFMGDCILIVTNIEIHFLPVDESHTYALSRDIKHVSLDGQVGDFFPML